MKHWENRLSAALLLVSGLTLAAILVLNLWIAPPGSGMVLIEAESRAEESSIESLPMPEPPGPVNLNTATLEELDTLPGIGEVIAGRILAYREEHGEFSSIEELMEVEGIGEKTFAELRDHVALE